MIFLIDRLTMLMRKKFLTMNCHRVDWMITCSKWIPASMKNCLWFKLETETTDRKVKVVGLWSDIQYIAETRDEKNQFQWLTYIVCHTFELFMGRLKSYTIISIKWTCRSIENLTFSVKLLKLSLALFTSCPFSDKLCEALQRNCKEKILRMNNSDSQLKLNCMRMLLGKENRDHVNCNITVWNGEPEERRLLMATYELPACCNISFNFVFSCCSRWVSISR